MLLIQYHLPLILFSSCTFMTDSFEQQKLEKTTKEDMNSMSRKYGFVRQFLFRV